jgi:hypothetical protein
MLSVAVVGGYDIYTALDDAGHHIAATSAATGQGTRAATPTPTALTAKEISGTAHAFLSAWQSGRTANAAELTDSVPAATTALNGYATEGHVRSVRITPGPTTADGERFTVTAHLSYQGTESDWTYASALTVDRDASGHPAVRWRSSVLHPDLAEGDSLVTGREQAPEIVVTDRHDTILTADRYPSLTRIIDDLTARYATEVPGGTPAVGTYVRKADGSQGATLHVLEKGTSTKVRTTLDASVQAAAEKALAGRAEAGVTALDTRSGEILAVAYTPPAGNDLALLEETAPGSTFKIVTAAALLEHGMTPSSPAQCKAEDNYGTGRMYHNDTPGLHNAHATLAWDFEQSCNTGFIRQAGRLPGSALRDTAARFGLTQQWRAGTPVHQPDVPGGGGPDELTSEMIGQGQLRMSPLIMASVAATASTGTFRQPRIVAANLIDGPVATSAGLLPGISGELRQMMRGAITGGTADAMRGFGPGSGAKTGSAEIDGQDTTNGWFAAYAGHVAAAAVVHDAGHGNTTAGPMVAAVLRAS